MTNFWGEESREIVRRVRLEFLYRVSPFRIASQTICETFNASQYMCSDGLRVTWNFSIRSSPPLGIFPPPSLIPSQTICHTLLCNRLCRVRTVSAWLEWPRKQDFVPSSERGTRNWGMFWEWFDLLSLSSLVPKPLSFGLPLGSSKRGDDESHVPQNPKWGRLGCWGGLSSWLNDILLSYVALS